jgi:hypothetical protein
LHSLALTHAGAARAQVGLAIVVTILVFFLSSPTVSIKDGSFEEYALGDWRLQVGGANYSCGPSFNLTNFACSQDSLHCTRCGGRGR